MDYRCGTPRHLCALCACRYACAGVRAICRELEGLPAISDRVIGDLVTVESDVLAEDVLSALSMACAHAMSTARILIVYVCTCVLQVRPASRVASFGPGFAFLHA
jgi:hypothetical protein